MCSSAESQKSWSWKLRCEIRKRPAFGEDKHNNNVYGCFLISKLSSPQTFETPEAQEPKRSTRILFCPTSEISCGLIAGVGSCLLSCLDPLGGPALPPSCPCSVTELLLATPGIVRRDLLQLEWGCSVVYWRRRGGGGVHVQSPSWRTLRSGAIYLIDPVAFAYVMLLTKGRVEDEINVGRGERRGKSTFG